MSAAGRIPKRALAALLALALLGAGFAVAASGHPMDLTDLDHDTLKNDYDNCPGNYNPRQQDNDGDSAEHAKTDAVPPTELPGNNGSVGGPYYGWTEGATLPDGSPDPRNRPTGVGGDACDEDDDNDGFPDKKSSKPEYRGKVKDNCVKDANPGQEDSDYDGAGDVCDSDDDNDTISDPADNCPLVSNSDQQDHDSDGLGNACDPDAPATGSLRGRDPNDRTAPTIAVKVRRKQRFGAIHSGIVVPVTCSEGCALEGELTVPGRTAKRLKVARRASKSPYVLARGAAQIEDKGFTYVFVKLSKTTLKRLQRARSLRSTLKVTAQDANGNRSALTRRVTLRR